MLVLLILLTFLVFCHRFDEYTPLEETCRAMNRVIEDNKAFYWGTSEWKASQIVAAFEICERFGLIKPIVEQPQYNMLFRNKFESEYSHLFKNYRLGTTTWSPLMSGILTGKYINETPKGSRGDGPSEAELHFKFYNNDKKNIDEKLTKLKGVADKLGCSLAVLCIAWIIKNPDVSTCLVGCSRVEQLHENLKAVEIMDKLTPEHEVEIEAILQNTPSKEWDWRDFKEGPGRRETLLGKK